MNIYLALLLFSFVVLLYWVITELFTFFFRLTGLPAERARFQVISLLTGTGFTTRESEIILSSRRRRRLCQDEIPESLFQLYRLCQQRRNHPAIRPCLLLQVPRETRYRREGHCADARFLF